MTRFPVKTAGSVQVEVFAIYSYVGIDANFCLFGFGVLYPFLCKSGA
jgi:hypothetical protein